MLFCLIAYVIISKRQINIRLYNRIKFFKFQHNFDIKITKC